MKERLRPDIIIPLHRFPSEELRKEGRKKAPKTHLIIPLIVAVVPGVRQDYQAVVRLAADDAADALRALPDGVEREEVSLSDL